MHQKSVALEDRVDRAKSSRSVRLTRWANINVDVVDNVLDCLNDPLKNATVGELSFEHSFVEFNFDYNFVFTHLIWRNNLEKER